MTLTQRFQDSSLRLINRYGASRTYRQVQETYNPITQTSVSSEVAYALKMFKTDPKERETKYPNLVGKETAVMLIAATALPVKPKVGDQITETYLGDTNTFSVEVIKENWSGEGVVSWRLVCSKS